MVEGLCTYGMQLLLQCHQNSYLFVRPVLGDEYKITNSMSL